MFNKRLHISILLKSFILIMSPVFLVACSNSPAVTSPEFEYSAPKLTSQGKTYKIVIEQKLDDSIIKASGKIRFTPDCEYFINANAYDDPSNEYVFTISKSARDTTFIQGRGPGDANFSSWGDFRDPLTSRPLFVLYPTLVLDGNEEGYLCNLDNIYNFIKPVEQDSYSWDVDFLENYTTHSSELWRESIVASLGMSERNKETLEQYLNKVIVPDYTFALQAFPKVNVTTKDNEMRISLENGTNASLSITLTEIEEGLNVKKVQAFNFPDTISKDVEGLTENQILEQFKPEK